MNDCINTGLVNISDSKERITVKNFISGVVDADNSKKMTALKYGNKKQRNTL